MTQAPNLFPDYPVASLGRAGLPTVTTQGIAKVTRLIELFFTDRSSPRSRGQNIPVQGDFGTGKTHLLAYAGEQFECRATSAKRSAIIVQVPALQTAPDEWYRDSIGPQLVAAGPEEMLFGVFTEVAKTVALKAPLTQGAAATIDANPASARTLVQRELLSPTSVGLELIERLEQIFEDADDEISVEVRRALVAMIWSPEIADRWLRGDTLLQQEQAATGLPPNVMTDDLASDAIVAFAAIAARVDRPFALMLDELEQFLRFDENEHTKRNVTWLKRLLERLIRCRALVLVAGQSDAWRGHPDFADRFTPGTAIELIPLDGNDVLSIVGKIQGSLGTFSSHDAERVADLSGGNMRQVLGMLHSLSDRTAGFTTELDDSAIEQAAAALAGRVEPERALEQVERLLADDFGLELQRQVRFGAGPQFDLVASEAGSPRVLVELKQAAFGQKQQEQVQRFIEKVRTVTQTAPGCIGCFVSESPVDIGLRDLVQQSRAPILVADLTDPGYLGELQQRLANSLSSLELRSARGGPAEATADADLSRLEDEIQALRQAQATFYDGLQDRLVATGDAVTSAGGSVQFHTAPAGDLHDVRRRLYEEFTAAPSRAKWLSQLVELRTLPVLGAVLVGAALLVQAGSLASSLYPNFSDRSTQTFFHTLFFVIGLMLVLVAVFFIARVYVLVDRFYEFKRNVLREIYLRDDLPVSVLTAANNLIEAAFDRVGPGRGVFEASVGLDELGVRYDTVLYSGSGVTAPAASRQPRHTIESG